MVYFNLLTRCTVCGTEAESKGSNISNQCKRPEHLSRGRLSPCVDVAVGRDEADGDNLILWRFVRLLGSGSRKKERRRSKCSRHIRLHGRCESQYKARSVFRSTTLSTLEDPFPRLLRSWSKSRTIWASPSKASETTARGLRLFKCVTTRDQSSDAHGRSTQEVAECMHDVLCQH